MYGNGDKDEWVTHACRLAVMQTHLGSMVPMQWHDVLIVEKKQQTMLCEVRTF